MAKFVKWISSEDADSNELRVPHAFCNLYVSTIPSSVKLVLPNGYGLWVNFDKVQEMFVGMRLFYQHFTIRRGHTLIFEYTAEFKFKVCIVGIDGAEIDYPLILNHHRIAEVTDDYVPGLTFVKHLTWGGKAVDEIHVPWQFLDRVGGVLPLRVEIVISCGQHIVCSFSETNQEIRGLVSLCNMLGIPRLNFYNMLLFKYDGVSTFMLTAFDASWIETTLSPHPVNNLQTTHVDQPAFQIVIQPFHMLRYCHGVDISTNFKNLIQCWKATEYITAYVGNHCWTVQIRKRRDSKRTTILDGWIMFRDDLELAVGDVCLFDWKNDSLRNFNVRIVKNNGIAN